MSRNRVFITGMGVISPLGCSTETFWAGLLAGRSGIRAIENMDLSHSRSRIGGQAVDFDPASFFTPREQKRMSRSSQMAVAAAVEALRDAGLDGEAPHEAGVIVGSSVGGFAAVEASFFQYFTKFSSDPLTIPRVMNSGPASNISIRFGLRGPAMAVDSACSSGAHAVGMALNMIRSGTISTAVTGGADSPFSPGVVQSWSDLRVLSARNDPPWEACRPFSADRDGLVLGEGAGILVLESEEAVRRRKARVYAEVTGYGATSDGVHLTQPSRDGIAGAMRLALRDAGLAPERVDFVSAHGTATPWNDATETEAIKEVFGAHARKIPVVGNKGATGHAIAATGALELVVCALSIRDQVVPPTLNVRTPDPACDLDYVTEGRRDVSITHAMSNSFAFGGSNAVLVVSRRQAEV